MLYSASSIYEANHMIFQGVSYTISTTTLPPLLALPTAQPAHTTFQHLRALTHRHQLILTTLSTSTLLLAYILSPPRGRHPYLLWATLAIGAGYGRDIWAGVVEKVKGKNGGKGKDEASGSDSSDEEWEVEGSVGSLNGEVVREGMEKWRGKMMGRTAVWGIGWLVTVVGLWGDKGVMRW